MRLESIEIKVDSIGNEFEKMIDLIENNYVRFDIEEFNGYRIFKITRKGSMNFDDFLIDLKKKFNI